MPVYFLRCGVGGPVKIGRAGDVQSRVRDLQCAHHETLTLLRAVPGDAREESWFHRHYRPLHIRGEWHRFCPTMLTVEYAPLAVVPEQPETHGRGDGWTVRKIIETLGGATALTKAMKFTHLSSVSNWHRTGIPRKHWAELVWVAERAGRSDVSLEALHEASAPPRSEAA